MNTQHFTIDIAAPKRKVWEVMLNDKTYREWTTAFHEGSYYEGSWDEGSKIQFLSKDEDGVASGMVSEIAENVPYDFISIEHLGEITDGIEDTTSERVQQWVGAHENYTFHEQNGVTTLDIELESDGITDEMSTMFEEMWPKALQKLKEIIEA